MAEQEEVIRGSVRFTETDIRRGLADMSPLGPLYLVFGAAMVVALGVLGAVSDGGPPVGWAVLLLAAPAVLAPIVARRAHARSVISTQHLAEGDVEYRLDSTGITIVSPGKSSSINHRVLHAFRNGRWSFLLYVGPRLASIVPKRAFRPEDQPRVEAILAGGVKPHRALGASHVFLLAMMLALAGMVVWSLVVHAVLR